MRTLIYAINLSIDGVVDHTKLRPAEDQFDYFIQLITEEVDTLVYGRITHQLMVPYWPDIAKNPEGETKSDVGYAKAFVAMKQSIVVSRSLDKVEEPNTRIIRTDLKEEILKLKQEDGKSMLTGGVSLPLQLAELGLIDEYRFVIHPLIVGEGRKLFDGIRLQEKLQLKLVESRTFDSGGVVLRYLK